MLGGSGGRVLDSCMNYGVLNSHSISECFAVLWRCCLNVLPLCM